jgi:AraC family transcriptional regulator of adaptative response/methylated-DNA-[protein]-cysteine methyltransferase
MSDYQRIARAIEFIRSRVTEQPSLAEVAAHIGLSPYHFQRLFSRWAGVTPKQFLQVMTVQKAKQLLQQSWPLLAVADEVGLSSGSRLYDHFIQLEAMTPGEYKRQGAGLQVTYGVIPTPFGAAFIASTARGISSLAFLTDQQQALPTPAQLPQLQALQQQWPKASFSHQPASCLALGQQLFNAAPSAERPLSLFVTGTNFQISVWRALLHIPTAGLASYSQIASAIGQPAASRAVGLAVGANPVALLIPCHRVIRHNGEAGGYHWGEQRKQVIQSWEMARVPNA